MKRIYIMLLFIILIISSIVGYAYYIEPNLLVVKSLDIKTKKFINPCKIAFFTDTHFGKHYDVHHIENIVAKINQAKVDIVIFGGDLLDNYARDRDELDLNYLKDELLKINATKGKYAVRGNHDYGGGSIRIYEEFMTSSNFKVLNNESVPLDDYGISLIGYDDYLMGWSDPSLYKIKSDLFHVIISHEPIISKYIESESDNFLLSGHTHGGQISIPFLTNKFLPEGSGQFKKGYYTKEEIGTNTSLSMYTSSGIGMTRYPFRFLNTPEIIIINLENTK